MPAPEAIRVGCSGWSYSDWRGRFYPPQIPERDWFSHYAATFDTVEINNTFYQMPTAAKIRLWESQAPPGFVYAVKVSRYITHMKKLKEPKRPLAQFIARVRKLGGHLGPLLYQLPPNWRCDAARLRDFLAMLPEDLVHVFEFRHQSWLEESIFALLDEHGASLCVHDMHEIEVPRVAVGKVAYVRFHGTRPGYAGGYPESALRSWARWLRQQARAGRAAFAYFNNDVEARAVADARALLRKVRRGVSPPLQQGVAAKRRGD